MHESIGEYVMARTERLLPKASPEKRNVVREGIRAYAEWWSKPRSSRGDEPQLGYGYKQIAIRIYSRFINEPPETPVARAKGQTAAGFARSSRRAKS